VPLGLMTEPEAMANGRQSAREFQRRGRIIRRRKQLARLEMLSLVKELLPDLDPQDLLTKRLRELVEILDRKAWKQNGTAERQSQKGMEHTQD